jgi:hypothetical protein
MRLPESVDRAVLDAAPGTPGAQTSGVVRGVMLTEPKTLPACASVDDARAVLAGDHVHMVLLTQGATLLGTLTGADLVDVPADEPALAWSVLSGRTVPPDASAGVVLGLLVRASSRRLAVVDADRTLLGLLCLKRSGTGFCSDTDVAARAADSTTRRRTIL